MNKKLQDVLNGSYGNYIMPFFWLHGSSEDILREYMEKIFNCGIRAVCLESRPHPDFVGEGWWKDLDIIMEEARNRQMRVWVLDDSHFPTGFANGAVRKAPDRLKRWSLIERTMKVDGPILGCRFAVHDRFFTETGGFGETDPKEELVAVIAGKRNDKDGCVYYSELIDVTDKVINGWLYMDIPEGNYCLFIYSKKMGAASKASDYISLLEKESVKILIDTVYEPHYRRYKDDFGETFAGFFSDEPGFYNLSGQPYELGKIGDLMPLPWTDRLRDQLCPDKGNKTKLVGLFHNCGGTEREIRFSYMDMITRMYENNFSIQLGKWCEERHVEYIGHVMEAIAETVTVTLPANAGAKRAGTLTIKTEFEEYTFTITQNGVIIELEEDPESTTISMPGTGSGMEKTVLIRANKEWKVEVPKEYQSWLKAEALSETELKITTTTTNNLMVNRVGHIIMKTKEVIDGFDGITFDISQGTAFWKEGGADNYVVDEETGYMTLYGSGIVTNYLFKKGRLAFDFESINLTGEDWIEFNMWPNSGNTNFHLHFYANKESNFTCGGSGLNWTQKTFTWTSEQTNVVKKIEFLVVNKEEDSNALVLKLIIDGVEVAVLDNNITDPYATEPGAPVYFRMHTTNKASNFTVKSITWEPVE